MTAVLQSEVNEIRDFIDACYLSAPEATWRLFGFKLHHRSPAIQRLQIHLLDQQTVTFDNNSDIVTLLHNEHAGKTTLTGFFITNKRAVEAATNGERLDFDCRQLLYQEFATHMVWNRRQHCWNR